MNKKDKKTISNRALFISIAALFAILLIWNYRNTQKPVTTIANPQVLPGLQTGAAPWIAETANLRKRLSSINLPALTAEGTALHTHQQLDIYINGELVPVPIDIGVHKSAGFISDIHTHDTSGIIHVESPRVQTYTLGQFFDIWGVAFTANSIGGYIADDSNKLAVYVNGSLYEGDPRQLPLESHQKIVITYGTDAQLPKPIPASYEFPAGL